MTPFLYQLGPIVGFSSVFSRIFSKILQKIAKRMIDRISLISYQLGTYQLCLIDT